MLRIAPLIPVNYHFLRFHSSADLLPAQFTYTVGHPEITQNDMIDLLIKRELTRTIGSLNNEITEEIDSSMEMLFGLDNQWKEVGVFDSLTRTVGRAANRVFVGKELCELCLRVRKYHSSTDARLQYGFRYGRCSLCERHFSQQLYSPPFPEVFETVRT